jgi:tRNA1(Val) A37 N6-methylase TrmN6
MFKNTPETLMPEPALTVDAFLGGRLTVAQPAHVPDRCGRSATVLDLGAGVGVVGLCVAARHASAQVTLVELQPDLSALAAQNTLRNGLEQRVRVITADVRDRPEQLAALGLMADTFDHVVCNPPFDIEGNGRSPPNALKARSHVMPAGELEQWGRVLARYSRASGAVTMIHRADALGAVLEALEGRFGGLRVLPLHPRAGEPATRILVQGIKGSRAPLSLLAGLVLHSADGHGFTAPMQAVLREGAALRL